MTRHTYTGPTDYPTEDGWFPGPHVTDAPILTVTPITFEAPTQPVVRLTVANPRPTGPRELTTAQWGTPTTWQPHRHPDHDRATDIVTALTTAGIPAHLHHAPDGQPGALLHIRYRRDRHAQLVITATSPLTWTVHRPTNTRPTAHPWPDTKPADVPARVRQLCLLLNARILRTSPTDAVPR
ncbi:hypothetical protein [Kitasatospora sp. NPDC092286]|uniref:hypothetical protein n=1 Tax=Kitasatospora sp. NPDC092286 TaxID=3364087 RepID=UPI0038244E27